MTPFFNRPSGTLQWNKVGCEATIEKPIIIADIITGEYAGETVFIPRITLSPNDTVYEFQRTQFPVRLSYAMSINKSQGQTLKVVGLNLQENCFSHGQFYVACSRVGGPGQLHMLTQDGNTKNIVYRQALQ